MRLCMFINDGGLSALYSTESLLIKFRGKKGKNERCWRSNQDVICTYNLLMSAKMNVREKQISFFLHLEASMRVL